MSNIIRSMKRNIGSKIFQSKDSRKKIMNKKLSNAFGVIIREKKLRSEYMNLIKKGKHKLAYELLSQFPSFLERNNAISFISGNMSCLPKPQRKVCDGLIYGLQGTMFNTSNPERRRDSEHTCYHDKNVYLKNPPSDNGILVIYSNGIKHWRHRVTGTLKRVK